MTDTPAVGTQRETSLTILLADEDEDTLRSLARALQELGHDVTPFAVSVQEAAELIVREDPDLAFVVVHHDDDHALAAIEVAMRRYREASRLNEKVGQLESALARRAVIERAKGILMERHGIGDREAFERLRAH